jgi:hypothetical protein
MEYGTVGTELGHSLIKSFQRLIFKMQRNTFDANQNENEILILVHSL